MNKTLFIGLLSLISIAATAQEKYMEHDADGRLRVLGYIDKKTEKKVGHWVEYGRNGRKISEVDYKNGQQEGMEYIYESNGKILHRRRYEAGTMLTDTAYEYNGIYITTMRRVTDPTDPEGFR